LCGFSFAVPIALIKGLTDFFSIFGLDQMVPFALVFLPHVDLDLGLSLTSCGRASGGTVLMMCDEIYCLSLSLNRLVRLMYALHNGPHIR
jgi:hypothetical protein